jgi:hypothetical protein
VPTDYFVKRWGAALEAEIKVNAEEAYCYGMN